MKAVQTQMLEIGSHHERAQTLQPEEVPEYTLPLFRQPIVPNTFKLTNNKQILSSIAIPRYTKENDFSESHFSNHHKFFQNFVPT